MPKTMKTQPDQDRPDTLVSDGQLVGIADELFQTLDA